MLAPAAVECIEDGDRTQMGKVLMEDRLKVKKDPC